MLTSDETGRPANRRTAWIVGAMGVALVIMGGVIAVLLFRNPGQAAAPNALVVLEPLAGSGQDPFVAVAPADQVTDTVKVDPLTDAVRSVAPEPAAAMVRDERTGTLSIAGTADNLYGGMRGESTELFGGSGSLAECDRPKLADFLATHPDKANAWAAARNITPGDIARYLQSLTPVILLHDTLVTNHGFHDGVATPSLSVLQAGTGVLVDSTGQPVVRCACGNPLTAPAAVDLRTAQLQGARWEGYQPDRAVVVIGGPPAAGLVLVDVSGGQSYTQPVGEPALPTPASTSPLSPAPTATTGVVSDCEFQLQAPFTVGPAWVDAANTGLSCTEMITQWQKYETWPGEFGGSMGYVDFPDGSDCVNSHGAPPGINLVGACDMQKGRFYVYGGRFGQRSADPLSEKNNALSISATASTAATTGSDIPDTSNPGPIVSQDSLVTPSGNIHCAIISREFHCTIEQYDFDLGPCNFQSQPFISLGPIGAASMSPCIGDSFVGAASAPSVYGTMYKLGDITCDVEETGVRCTNPEGHGFTLSRAAFSPF